MLSWQIPFSYSLQTPYSTMLPLLAQRVGNALAKGVFLFKRIYLIRTAPLHKMSTTKHRIPDPYTLHVLGRLPVNLQCQFSNVYKAI